MSYEFKGFEMFEGFTEIMIIAFFTLSFILYPFFTRISQLQFISIFLLISIYSPYFFKRIYQYPILILSSNSNSQ